MALNTSTSIIDYLKSQGKDSSYGARSQLATQYGIQNYAGTPEQNVQLLKTLQGAGSQLATNPNLASISQGIQNIKAQIPGLTTGVNNAVTNYQTTALPTAPVQQPITSQVLAPQTQIQTAQYIPPPPPPVQQLNYNFDTQPLSQPEQQGADLNAEIRKISEGLLGESQYRLAQEQALGLPQLQASQRDLSAQLQAIQNEQKQIDLQFQDYAPKSGIAQVFVDQKKTEALRANAIKALGVSSLLEASKGNLQTAQDMVERAVAAKYGPIKEEINVKLSNLDLLQKSPNFTKAEQDRANAQKVQLQKQQAEIDTQTQNAKYIYQLALDAQKQGVTDVNTLQAIQNAPTPQEAYNIARNATINTTQAQTVQDPSVSSWVNLVKNGQVDITSVPTALRNSVVTQVVGQGGITKPHSTTSISGASTKINKLTADEWKRSYSELPSSFIGKDEDQLLKELQNTNPASWFRDIIEQKLQLSVSESRLKTEWQTFRQRVLTQVTGGGSSSSQSPSSVVTNPYR